MVQQLSGPTWITRATSTSGVSCPAAARKPRRKSATRLFLRSPPERESNAATHTQGPRTSDRHVADATAIGRCLLAPHDPAPPLLVGAEHWSTSRETRNAHFAQSVCVAVGRKPCKRR